MFSASWVLGPGGYYGTTGVFANAYASAAAAGFAAGGIQGGNLNSALSGAVSAAAFYGVGELSGAHSFAGTKEQFFLSPEHVQQTLGHALVGCAQAASSGSSCASGASAAAFAAVAGPIIPGEVGSASNFAGRVVVGALGGKLGGGSYEGGAFTAAFGYLFNECGSAKGCAKLFGYDTSSPKFHYWRVEMDLCDKCTNDRNAPYVALAYATPVGGVEPYTNIGGFKALGLPVPWASDWNPMLWAPYAGGIIYQMPSSVGFSVTNYTYFLHPMHDGVVEFSVVAKGDNWRMIANGVGENGAGWLAGLNNYSGQRMFNGLMGMARSCYASKCFTPN